MDTSRPCKHCKDVALGSEYLMGILSIVDNLKRGAATVRKWKQFRHQTGEWPLLSITFSFFQNILLVLGMIFLIWYSAEHHWSKNRLGLVGLAAVLPFILVWGSLQDKIWLEEIRRARQRGKTIHLN